MKMCISNKKTNTCDKHYYQRYNNQRRYRWKRWQTSAVFQTAKPSRKTASKKALISPTRWHLPAPQAFQNVHFLQCWSPPNHLVRTSAPTQGRYHSTDCSCQSERINKINFLFIDCGDWCHRAHHTTKCSQQLQQESKTYVHTIKKWK